MKCFTFWENFKTISILDIENHGFILNTCHHTAKRAETRVGFPVIFTRLRWPIEPKFSQVCYFIYKLWYTKCWPWTVLLTKCPMALMHICVWVQTNNTRDTKTCNECICWRKKPKLGGRKQEILLKKFQVYSNFGLTHQAGKWKQKRGKPLHTLINDLEVRCH